MRNQFGVSMIEVLITIVVMSFGFLSLAAFQMGTLKHLSGSNQHYLVTSLATSIGESVRANDAGVTEYHEQETNTFTKDCSVPANCTIAEQDLARWKNMLETHALQDGSARVEIDGNNARIAISWVEKSTSGLINTGGSEKQNYTLQVPL